MAQSGGGAGAGEDVDWKERCHTLEVSLQKFKQQVPRIKELLTEKMQELEQRTKEAEARAEKSEEKGRTLEGQLAAMNYKPEETDKRLHGLETQCREKDKTITALNAQVHELKQQRVQDSKLLEEKSAKIREWVSKKVRDLEQQNYQFRLENDTLRTQVEVLRGRLQALPVDAAREIHRRSLQDGDSRPESMDNTPPIPARPASSILECFRQERERELTAFQREILAGLPGNMEGGAVQVQTAAMDATTGELEDQMGEDIEDDFEPLYQEIDDNHESKYEPKRMVPPQIRIERKVFPNPQLYSSSMVSSTTGSEEMLDRPGASFHTPPTLVPVSVATQPPRLTPIGGRVTNGVQGLEQPPSSLYSPREGPAQPVVTHFLPPNAEDESCMYAVPHSTQTFDALATLPRRRKDNRIHIKEHSTQQDRVNLRGTKDDSSTIPFEHARGQAARARMSRPKPPTPPMRRLPSWENRIYAIANIGLRLPEPSACRESSFPVTDGLYTEHMYAELAVPVYTTLKGKAAQIRSTPFTGDSSSDSSDNEEQQVAMATESDSEAVMTVAGPSGSKTTTSVTMRKPVNQTSSGAMKRGVSSHSIGSETSSDYAVPPDEVSIMTDSSDNSEPEQKLLKYTADHLKKDSLEKCGYLTKMGGKVKSWKSRWFVLKNGELLYYKSPNDVARKPQGYITLDGQTRVNRAEGALTFEIATLKKTYYMSAESTEDMDHWIRVLQNVLKKQAADKVLGQTRAKEVMKGWLIKTKHGRSRRCWCVLLGKFFMYYKNPNDKTPLGQIHLRDARIEEVDRSCDSESDSDDTAIPDYTLGIWPNIHSPTYLMIPTKHEKDSWLYHLTVAAGGGTGKVGTECEQLVSKLMEVDGDPGCVYWKHPTLLHIKEPLQKPLTTLPSADLQEKALDLFKICHTFMNMAIESPQIDYHVSLAQSIMEMCLQHPELQNELYCQLIKQTSRHPPQHKSGMQNLLLCGSHSWFLCDASPTSPTSSVLDLTDSKLNPVNYVLVQGWQLLAMCVSLFLPRQSILWYLKAHLSRNAEHRSDAGKLAVFCQRALERTLHNGGREARPSRMEVMSILLRNPYHHSQPISIPVHFLNSTYEVVSFDGSTTVQEFLQTLNKAINCRDCPLSGYALFTDDPANRELEHCLKGHLKLCDVISKWEQAFLHHHSVRGRPDTSRTVKLTYKNRMYFKSLSRGEAEKEKLLLVYQLNEEILNGRFPLNRDLAMEMAALMAQIEHGDFRLPGDTSSVGSVRIMPPTSQQQLPLVVEKFFPKRYRDLGHNDLRILEQRIADKWQALRGKSSADCVRIYLTVARKWPFFGAKLFSAKVKFGEPCQVWLAVQEDCISILEYATLKPVTSYDYKNVVTFGGCREDFMLVVNVRAELASGQYRNKTDRLLFVMTKPKILEVTMLMASYINSRGQHRAQNGRPELRSRAMSSHSTATTATAKTTSMEV